MKKHVPIIAVMFFSFFNSSFIAKVEPTSPSDSHILKSTETNVSEDKAESLITPNVLFGIKTVVIDAGHGGKDPGCLGQHVQEKDVALGIALKLGAYIQKNCPDVKVIYTRSTDVFVELDERAAIANRNKADLFICIHCNTACSYEKKKKKLNCNEDVFGTETYVMGLHKTNANLNVARRENASILLEKNYKKHYDGFDPNSETGYILLTMQQNAYLKQSLNFATKVQKEVKEKAGRIDKGVQQAGFLVLWRTAMPSVLIETEFLSNPAAEKFVGSDKGQDYMAQSIYIAFRQYKDEVEGKLAKYDDINDNIPPYVPQKDTLKKATTNNQDTLSNNDKHQPKDSLPSKKEPIIDNETKIEISPKDSSLTKDTLIPPIKNDTSKTLSVKKNKDVIKKTTKDSTSIIPPQKKSDIEANDSIVYKIQFMSGSQRIPLLSEKFKGLNDVAEYEDNGLYKYTAGEFKTIREAMNYRSEMQKKKFKDCFVVKFKNGKRLKNDK